MVFAAKNPHIIQKGTNFLLPNIANYAFFEGSFECPFFRCKAGFHFMHPWLGSYLYIPNLTSNGYHNNLIISAILDRIREFWVSTRVNFLCSWTPFIISWFHHFIFSWFQYFWQSHSLWSLKRQSSYRTSCTYLSSKNVYRYSLIWPKMAKIIRLLWLCGIMKSWNHLNTECVRPCQKYAHDSVGKLTSLIRPQMA